MPGLSMRGSGTHRALAVSLSVALEIGIVLLLWLGLAPPAGLREAMHRSLTAISLPTPQALAPVKPPPPRHQRPAGRAAPAGLRAKAAPVFAADLPLPPPMPIPVSPMPASGTDAHSGAAPTPGPGPGAGGQGDGHGAGGSGTGDGDGGSQPEWIGGRIKSSDYPQGARQARAQGTTSVTIAIDAQGRPRACHLLQSSHNGDLDRATCDLVLRRFRFRPARDEAGHAIAGEVDYDQEWTLGDLSDAP